MDLEAKKKLLKMIPSGLYIVGLASENEIHAFTGSWATQISMKPPMVAIGVRKDSHSLEVLKKGGVLILNYMDKSKQDIVAEFFKPMRSKDSRLGKYSYELANNGAPILDEAFGVIQGNVIKIDEDLGDHALVVFEVKEAAVTKDKEALIMSDTPWSYGG